MQYKKYVVVIAIAALLISSCTMSYPGADATPIPTNPFAKPLATNQMDEVQGYATGTALAKTAIAGGGTVSTPTPGGDVVIPSSTPILGGIVPTNTPLGGSIIPSSTPAIGGAGGNVPTSTIAVVTDRPATYTLQSGEHPYCIARRYNVDPVDLLSLSGLTINQAYSLPAGTLLRIPQTGSFPGDLALRPHPTTYTVTSSDETFYSIACLFGNVHPSQIAQANGIALGSPLHVGQVLQIP